MRKRWTKRCVFLVLVIFATAATATAAMTPPLTDKELLGKKLFYDANLSDPKFQSCAVCHLPTVGWTGPDMNINAHGAVYEGAVWGRFGNRKPPSAAYATLSPKFKMESPGEFVGGNFWDGRATGEKLGNPAADQALGPFLNPVEQNNPSKKAVCMKVAQSQYAYLWMDVWGEPISCDTMEQVELNYDRIGLAIAEFEDSDEVNQFSSKWDYVNKPGSMVNLNPMEMRGKMLFFGPNDNDGTLEMNEGAGCSACHPDGLFTAFSYKNVGTPKNPENPFYYMDKLIIGGQPFNPQGKEYVDPGLGGFLETRPEWKGYAEENMGKHKVPTLRNVDSRPNPEFVKAFTHNGYFKTLKGLVHFYNTRDQKGACDPGDPFDPTDDYTEAMALKYDCWPAPEVMKTLNTEVGDLGLSEPDEKALVAFLKTLSDGYDVPLTGEKLYMEYCMGCHGSADPAVLKASPVAPRKVIGARPCSIKGAIYGTYVFKKGVKAMQFMQGSFTDNQIMMISDYLNSFEGIMGKQRFMTTCAGCHGIDAKGGRVDEEIWGTDAYEIKETIYDEDPMRFLKCLPFDDVRAIGGYLSGYEDGYYHEDDKSEDMSSYGDGDDMSEDMPSYQKYPSKD